MRWAWLETRDGPRGPGKLHAVAVPADDSRSAVAALIESVYEAESRHTPSRARSILRERIFSSVSPTLTELELVKVAAKRMTAPAELDPRLRAPNSNEAFFLPPLVPPRPRPDFGRTNPEREELDADGIRGRLEKLKQEGVRESSRWASDRPVAAMLVDPQGRAIAEAWNTNSILRNRHAEWNLCELLQARGQRIRTGARLWVTLKPCRMCAARIWEAAEDPASLEVLYLEDDPGALARGTLLDSGSPARIRLLGKGSPLLSANVQRKASPSDFASPAREETRTSR